MGGKMIYKYLPATKRLTDAAKDEADHNSRWDLGPDS